MRNVSRRVSKDLLPDNLLQDNAHACNMSGAKPELDEDPMGSPEVTSHDPRGVAMDSPSQSLPHVDASGSKARAAKELLEAFVNSYQQMYMNGLEQTEKDDQDPHNRVHKLLQRLQRKEEELEVLDWSPVSRQPQAFNTQHAMLPDGRLSSPAAASLEQKTHRMQPEDETVQEAMRRYECMLMMLKAQVDHPQLISGRSRTD